MNVNDYVLDHSSQNWQTLFASWTWLLDDEAEIEPWLMNSFGDLFLLDEEGVVLWLNITDGELVEVAGNADEFFSLLQQSIEGADDGTDAEDNDEEDDDLAELNDADQWFLADLVDEAVEAGLVLGPNQCYGFKVLPVLGGEYDVSNLYVSSIEAYWGFCGHVHAQISGLPDGTEVEIDIPER